jgi:hypothetical protein
VSYVMAIRCSDTLTMLISLIQRYAPDPEAVWSWSRWRRRRQYQARLCHYRRRGYQLT